MPNVTYNHGDLHIRKEKLDGLMKKVGKGNYDTFDLIKEYQGFTARNEGKSGGDSWNASFGKILKQYAKDHPQTICEVKAAVGKTIGGGGTEASVWEVY